MSSYKVFLILECVVLFIGIPLMFFWVIPLQGLFAIIWLAFVYTSIILSRYYSLPFSALWQPSALNRANIYPIIRRFMLSALVISGYVIWFEPDRFLSFISAKPVLWAFVMVLYPLLSVIPQEVIYRVFFFERYALLFPTNIHKILASACTFGFAHIVFNNVLAPLFCLIGGLYFSQTYKRSRSLALVWFEHSLYGCFIFTIGLGWYFFHGAHTHG